MLSTKEIAEYYDRIAESFHQARIEGGKFFNESIEKPAILRLLADIRAGASVLDIGCGTGIYCRELAKRGMRVTAVDVSQGMLDIAKIYCQGLDIEFMHASFEDADFLGRRFEVVLGSFMLGYFADLAGAFSKMHSLLERGGALVASMVHPIRMNAESHDHKAYTIENYFGEGEFQTVILRGERPIPQPKRTISDVVEAAFSAGLLVDRLLEPKPQEELGDPVRYDFYSRCPSVLALRLREGVK